MKFKKKDFSISIYLSLFVVSIIIIVVFLLTISFRQILKDSLLSTAFRAIGNPGLEYN